MEESLHRLRQLQQTSLGNKKTSSIESAGIFQIGRREVADQDLLHRTVQDACEYAYGTKMVEVWVWDPLVSKLFRPEGGWWIDPYWHDVKHAVDGTCTFCQLVDKTRNDYFAPPLLSPGVGIPGILWSDLSDKDRKKHRRQGSLNSGGGSPSIDPIFLLQAFGNLSLNETRLLDPSVPTDCIAWRDIKALSNDPDQPRNHRLQLVASTNLRWAGGVPFQNMGERGVIVYYARESVHLDTLRDRTNTDYLVQAADLIGSAWVLRHPRKAALARRQEINAINFRRCRKSLIFLLQSGITIQDLARHVSEDHLMEKGSTSVQLSEGHEGNADERKLLGRFVIHLQRKGAQFLRKFRGSGTALPPVASWKYSLHSSLGVLLSLMILGSFEETLSLTLGEDYGFPMAPLAALLALQFGLSAAPAAQPPVIMAGHLVSSLLGLMVANIPSLKPWMKQGIACALATGFMSKFSIVTPPAAATAYVLANGTSTLTNMIAMMLSCMIAIACSMAINNISDKRQYPNSWGIPTCLQERIIRKRAVGCDEEKVELNPV